jgi:hypothetical protein
VRHGFLIIIVATAALGCSDSSKADDPGGPCGGDADGVIGGNFTFDVTVNDTGFSPVILKAQNNGQVTLTVKNTGTKPHDFVVQCLTAQGCTACFPDSAKVAPVAPGATATATFTAPGLEGIYTIGSDVPGDAFTGQFILQ